MTLTEKEGRLHEAPNKIVLSKSVGGNISRYPVEFTKDSKYFFSSVGSSVKVYSMATGAVVKVLSQTPTTGHSAEITCVMLNPKNPLQLYTASLDGTIKLWDYNDNILLKTYNVRSPIQFMVMSQVTPNDAYIVVKTPEEKTNSTVYSYQFGEEPLMRSIYSLNDCSSLDLTRDGQWLAFAGRYTAYTWKVNSDKEISANQINQHQFTELLTVLRFHPDRPILAIGDRSGRVTTLANYSSLHSSEHIRSVLHWHHLPVRCLCFMADGVYLMSGGEEAVLVIWQLETGHKQFLPRLGGSIDCITISPNNRFYCVGLDDNSIRLVNGITQTIEQVIQGLQHSAPLLTGMLTEPRNHHLVMNGVTGSLQFYNAKTDSHVMDLEVVPLNRVVRTDEKEIIHTQVTHVAFLPNGEWMATVDRRDDHITSAELFLKFWRWDPDTQDYKLHTRVDYPHTKPITSLVFNPKCNEPMAITTSEDKTFKVWSMRSEWICRSVGVYRDSEANTAAFSADGSVLAVAFGETITLWDPYLNSIQAVLAQPTEAITRLSFLGENCPFMIAVTHSGLVIWNLLTCKIWWGLKIKVRDLAVDARSNQFAVVRNKGGECRLIVFKPESNIPVALKHCKHTSLAISWLPNEKDESFGSSSLVALNEKHEMSIYSLGNSQLFETVIEKEVVEERQMLNEMYGMRREERETEEQRRIRLKTAQQMREEAMTSIRKEKTKREEGTLSAPSHVLPQVESLFETFMDSIMALRIEPEQPIQAPMELDTKEEIEHVNETQNTIINTPEADFPSLLTYFTTNLAGQPLARRAVVIANDSSSEDDSDEEDPSKIDW
ncbi:hypothetical protein G6F56_001597 [Rhizopus delemar]|nr:hypothetical protein G6F56_001597 [Rhizopus delemar]